jgi:penicillin-binding protein 1A
MDDKYSIEKERVVLEEFDKIKEAFRAKRVAATEAEASPATGEEAPLTPEEGAPLLSEEDTPLTLEDLFEEPADDISAGEADAASMSPSSVRRATTWIRAVRSRRGKKKHRINWKKTARAALVVMAVVIAATGGAALLAIKDAPSINPDNIYDLLSENSVIYDVEGQVIDNVFTGNALRTNVSFQQLPDHLVDAVTAIEDRTFWTHNGFNFIRIGGAIWDSVKSGNRIGGTSTITQQLARNLYIQDRKGERSMTRKILEAYYTVILERKLSKEQILEAYLNTIYLGFNANGVQAAAQAYFSKDVEDLTLVESAMLAALPQSPGYAPVRRIATEDVEDFEALDIIEKDDNWTTYYNSSAEGRMQLTLKLMHKQGKLNDEEYELAMETSIRDSINPGTGILAAHDSSFFSDYVVDQVTKDLSRKLGIDEEEALDLVYNGGLQIYSTLSLKKQKIVEEEYAKTSNFPSIGYATKDKSGNILDSTGKVLLYNMQNFFAENGDFTMSASEFKWNDDGSLTVYKGHRLNIYKTSVQGKTDYSVEFKDLYETINGILYSRAGGVWNVAAEYKDRDKDGNLLLSAAYFEDKPEAFLKNEDGTLVLRSEYYTLKQAVIQPQSAMVIMDHRNGHIIAMAGGRDMQGRKLYNRALAARQPGSAIKPLSVYAVALQSTVDGVGNWTAASPIDDIPMKYGGQAWPKNWYEGYTGINTLRRAVEQSINACAVNTWMQLDPKMSVDFLTNMGVTTVVESGEVNDINASALALGGMTKGISTLEMTAAFATFGHDGTYIEPVCYTRVLNRNGDLLLEKTPITRTVMDESVASLMTQIMQTTVTNGIASGARISAQPVAGKTGTTSERHNIWFCGLTPQYSAALWVGNDVNIPLNRGSDAATALWSKIMQRVMADIPREEFVMKGEFVNATVDRMSGKLPTSLSQADTRGTLVSDIFIKGTVPSEQDDAHVTVTVCAETGYLATPYCSHTVNKLAVIRPGGMSWEKTLATYPMSSVSIRSIPDAIYDAPDYYCPVHNPDPAFYPVSPLASEQKDSNPLDMDPVETPNGSENGNGSGNGNGSENGNGNGDGPSEGEDDPGTGGTEDESH